MIFVRRDRFPYVFAEGWLSMCACLYFSAAVKKTFFNITRVRRQEVKQQNFSSENVIVRHN